METLEVRGVSVSFDGRKVLEDVSVTLRKGELVCLLGVSGGGKTTLFNVISGLLKPDAGQVLLDGEDITGKPGHISYMLQKDLLLPYRTIEDNVALPLLLRGVKKREARKQASALFEEFDLGGTEKLWPSQLSGGMRQRAALLRTYLFSQDVALLDEPFSALDTLTKSAIHRWYLDVMERIHLSTLFITHDMDEAVLLSDRIYLLTGQPGRITSEIVVEEPRPRRQDFNLSPRPYWMAADEAEGRAGIHEVQYINGLYRLWRELKRKFPALLIDNCATGGRRLDFAALRYTVPLWGSDMSCFPDVRAEWQQEHVFGLSYWLPEFSFGTQNQSGGDSYMFRSAAAAGVVVHLFSYQRTPVSAEYPVEWLFRMLEEAREAAPCHAGDFYPLTEYTHTHRAWQVWQFDRPDLGTGVLKIFRSAASPYERGRFCLRGLHPERIYQLYTVAEDDGGGSVPEGEFTGRELLETGLELTLTMPRSSRVIFYRRVLESGKTDTYYAAEPKESIQQDA